MPLAPTERSSVDLCELLEAPCPAGYGVRLPFMRTLATSWPPLTGRMARSAKVDPEPDHFDGGAASSRLSRSRDCSTALMGTSSNQVNMPTTAEEAATAIAITSTTGEARKRAA